VRMVFLLLVALGFLLFACAAPATTPTAAPTATLRLESMPTPAASPTLPVPSPVPSTTAPVPTVASTAAPAAPDFTRLALTLKPVASEFNQPVFLTHAGDDRMFVVERHGTIRIIAGGQTLSEPFLDIRDRVGSQGQEQGLLGLAFHPQYRTNGQFFINYTDRQGDTVISRFHVTSDDNRADGDSEEIMLRIQQPAANHNGGMLAFGPDGYLYVGTGDGGAANDRFRNGQNLQSLLGKLLRLDVDGERPYAIPHDNPFVGRPEIRAEIWAYGLRNPWRFSFDRATGNLSIADVGQDKYEEVDWQPANSHGGENYGWPIMEGLHCFSTCRLRPNRPDPARRRIRPQRRLLRHRRIRLSRQGLPGVGRSLPLCRLLFGNNMAFPSARQNGEWTQREKLQTALRVSSFGEDSRGEIYVIDLANGGIFHLIVEQQ